MNAWRALALGLLLVVVLVTPAAAQEVTPTPTPPPAQVESGAIGDAVSGAVVGAIGTGLTAWLTGSGPEILVRVCGLVVGLLWHALRDWLLPIMGASTQDNLLVTLPASLTTQAPWVVDSWRLFHTVALAALGGGFVLVVVTAALRGLFFGATWQEATGATPAVIAALLLIHESLSLAEQLRRLVNALAGAFVQGTAHLPGWDTLSGAQQVAGEGLGDIAMLVLGVFIVIARFVTVELFNLCTVLLPLAILLAVLPGCAGMAWWVLGKLLRAAVVQIPMALAIGQGAALVAAFGAGGGALSLGLGIACYWLAARLPAMLSLGPAGGSGLFRNAVSVASFAVAGFAGGAVAGTASVREVAGGATRAVATPLIEATSYRLAPLTASTRRALPNPT